MRTPLQAMLWELWRTSRFELLFRIVGQSALILLIFAFADLSEPQANVIRGIVVLLLTASSVFSLTWLNELESETSQNGFSFRLGFTRPVSTTWLVFVPMLFTVGAAVICYIFPASLCSLLLGVAMPIVGPAVVIACLVACFVASTWSPITKHGKGLAIVAVLIGEGVVFFLFNRGRGDPAPILLAIGKPEYFSFAWTEYVALLLVSTFAFVVTVFAVDRQRHGDRWQLDVQRWWPAIRVQPRGKHRPFSSPFTAQFWYEMRRFGNMLLFLGLLFPPMVLILVTVVPWFDPERKEGGPVVSLFALAVCPFVYQLFGADGAIGLKRKQGAVQYSAFDATVSMANDQLIAIKLLVIAACSLVGWLCMALAVALHTAVVGNWQVWGQLGEALSSVVGDVPVYSWAACLANVALLYISSSSMLLAFGLWLPLYRRRFVLALCVLYLQVLLASWDAANGWPLRYVWLAYGYLLSGAIVAGCVLAMRKAMLAGYLGKRLFGCAFCLWVIYVSSTVALYLKLGAGFPIPRVVAVLGVSLLLVPLASTAIAPLALGSHRHA